MSTVHNLRSEFIAGWHYFWNAANHTWGFLFGFWVAWLVVRLVGAVLDVLLWSRG